MDVQVLFSPSPRGNIWDDVRTQLNDVFNEGLVVLGHFNVEVLNILVSFYFNMIVHEGLFIQTSLNILQN